MKFIIIKSDNKAHSQIPSLRVTFVGKRLMRKRQIKCTEVLQKQFDFHLICPKTIIQNTLRFTTMLQHHLSLTSSNSSYVIDDHSYTLHISSIQNSISSFRKCSYNNPLPFLYQRIQKTESFQGRKKVLSVSSNFFTIIFRLRQGYCQQYRDMRIPEPISQNCGVFPKQARDIFYVPKYIMDFLLRNVKDKRTTKKTFRISCTN